MITLSNYMFIITLYLLIILVYYDVTYVNSASNTKSSNDNEATIKFIEYPHLPVFTNYLEDGRWYAGNETAVNKYIYNCKGVPLDNIQRVAYKEGIFVPNRKKFPKYHIFSSEEAHRCLKGRNIYFLGDSYMRQMFIGLTDILFNTTSNVEILSGHQRERLMSKIRQSIKETANWKFRLRTLFDDCRHEDIFCIRACMRQDESWREADAVVGNILVHHLQIHTTLNENTEDFYINELKLLFHLKQFKITWATGPSYHIDLVPEKYKTITRDRPSDHLNFEALDLGNQTHTPVIDFLSLTHSCKWSNCSSDGGHRSRFVNRMKAQIFLNNLCEVNC